MRDSLRTLAFGRDWRDPVSGLALGVGLSVTAHAFFLMEPAPPFYLGSTLVVIAVGILYIVRSDPGLFAAWVAMALPFYLYISAIYGCSMIYPGRPLACSGRPQYFDQILQLSAAVGGLLITLIGYSTRRAIRALPRVQRHASRDSPGDQ